MFITVQVLRDLGYVAPGDAEQLPYDPPKEHVPMAEMLFGKARQWHLEMQQHPNEHNVIAVCVALVLLSDAFLTVRSQVLGMGGTFCASRETVFGPEQ